MLLKLKNKLRFCFYLSLVLPSWCVLVDRIIRSRCIPQLIALLLWTTRGHIITFRHLKTPFINILQIIDK